MDFLSTIRNLCAIFNQNAVDYLIVGGTAVALHGHYRQSTTAKGDLADKPDLDFWYNPSYDNYYRLLKALEQLGQDVTKYRDEAAPDPKKSFFKFEAEDYTLDLLPTIKAPIKFSAAFAKREVFKSGDVAISFISLDDLIQDKAFLARPKDRDDIKHLKK
jgi:hypothetical protein